MTPNVPKKFKGFQYLYEIKGRGNDTEITPNGSKITKMTLYDPEMTPNVLKMSPNLLKMFQNDTKMTPNGSKIS